MAGLQAKGKLRQWDVCDVLLNVFSSSANATNQTFLEDLVFGNLRVRVRARAVPVVHCGLLILKSLKMLGHGSRVRFNFRVLGLL